MPVPTHEDWLSENIVQTTWNGPLRDADIAGCFKLLGEHIDKSDHTVHLLFNIANAGMIPLQAPTLFLHSGIFRLPNRGKIAVFGVNNTGHILGRVASTMTGVDIQFFDDEEHALEYLNTT